MNVIENASAMAISIVQQIEQHAKQNGHQVTFKNDRVCVYAGTFNTPEFEYRLLAKMAMVAAVLEKPFVLKNLDKKTPIPYVESPDQNRSEVFLGLNTQLSNFISQQPAIPHHCVMFRVADNDINSTRPAFAELLNMYADGNYHSIKYERDSIMYMYYMGQIQFELAKFEDTHSIRLESKYEAEYVRDLNAIIINIAQEFAKG